jgi:hypothetical protein
VKLKLVRNTSTKGFTEGKLYVDGIFECYTIEDEDRKLESAGVKVQNLTAIPKGIYNMTISMSNRFKKFLIEVLEVNQFSGIRMHSGNSSKDTEGCIIVGSINDRTNDDWIGGSKIAYEALHKKVKTALSNKEKVTLEIV